MKKFFKNNKKGVSGVDISVAIVVILIGLSLILSLIVSINRTSKKVKREIQATQLAKEIFEQIKLVPYDDFLEIVKTIDKTVYENNLGITIPPGFNVIIETENKTPTNITEAILYNIGKRGNIKIEYMINNQETDIKLPYVKYFDKIDSKNGPDLNSTVIESDNEYSYLTVFEPIFFLEIGEEVLPTSVGNVNEWKKYGKGDKYFEEKYAKRLNTLGDYDFFKWEPRYITENEQKIFLIGRTMSAIEPYEKSLGYPEGETTIVNLIRIKQKSGTPLAGSEEGRWVKITGAQ